jgi:hypothetical protein
VGVQFLIIMYAAVVLGGLGSILGAFWGGLIIGFVQQVSALFMPLELQSAASSSSWWRRCSSSRTASSARTWTGCRREAHRLVHARHHRARMRVVRRAGDRHQPTPYYQHVLTIVAIFAVLGPVLESSLGVTPASSPSATRRSSGSALSP